MNSLLKEGLYPRARSSLSSSFDLSFGEGVSTSLCSKLSLLIDGFMMVEGVQERPGGLCDGKLGQMMDQQFSCFVNRRVRDGKLLGFQLEGIEDSNALTAGAPYIQQCGGDLGVAECT